MTTTISPELSLADLVVEEPSRSRVFEQFGLDYCCGGGHTLEEACRKRGVPIASVLAALEPLPSTTRVDWASAPISDLIAHIVDTHHAYLRQELPRLSRLFAEVARAHGGQRPELMEVSATFETLRAELEGHLDQEEERAFPVFEGAVAGSLGLLELLEHDHADTGRLLERLSELTGGFDQAAAFCGTHRAALDGLRELARDTHEHVHEENNILFPRVRALAAEAA
jgi:regulator of cell morphogenesis and NO signaling